MQIKPSEISIDEANIFAKDLLDRQSEIKNLTPIILNVQAPLVLSLDSQWGTGKTTFVKLWHAYLLSEHNQSIYFNAWETDFAEDPLVVLVSELDKWVKANKKPALINQWTAKVKKALPGITKRAVTAGVKAVTLGALELDEQMEGIAADLAGGLSTDLLGSFNKQSKAIDEFKKIVEFALEDFGSDQKNLIVFIDELDRCRPTYAIELLERIKHLFDIKRLVFVLSTDMTQLAHSIRGVYGHQFDAKKYLQRFIDLDYSLKQPDNKKYIDSQLQGLHFKDRTERNYTQQNIVVLCYLMAKRFALTLRQINLLLTRISLISCSISKNEYFDEPLIIALLVLRSQKKALYESYVKSPIVADQVIEFIDQGLSDEDKKNEYCNMVGYLIAPARFESDDIQYEKLLQPYKEASKSDDHNARWVGIKVLETIRNLQSIHAHKNTIAKVELFYQFTIE